MVGTCLWLTHGSLAALVDDQQLLGLQALSGPSAPVVSQRPACPTRKLVRELHLLSLGSDTCVKEQTTDSSNASAVKNLISTWYTSLLVCVATRVVDVACCWRCSFQPLWVRSFSLSVSITHRVVLNLDHASRRSGPRPLSSGFLSRDHPIYLLGRVCESAGFTQVLVIVGAAAGCLTFSSVCLSRPARRSCGFP